MDTATLSQPRSPAWIPPAVPHAPDRLTRTVCALVASDQPDLSLRQMAVLMLVYRRGGDWTVRGLATELQINKPAVTRSIDRLRDLGLARRVTDPRDARSVLVARTSAGTALVNRIARIEAT